MCSFYLVISDESVSLLPCPTQYVIPLHLISSIDDFIDLVQVESICNVKILCGYIIHDAALKPATFYLLAQCSHVVVLIVVYLPFYMY